MSSILNSIYNYIMTLISSSVVFGPILACLLIFLESVFPVLPLFVFITIIFIAYGYVVGFLLSYILTCLGCFFAFFLCRKYLKNFFEKKIRKNNFFDKFMKKIDKMSLSNIVLLISIPFTPQFVINIAAALSKMSFKKYMISILIGKLFLVAFWGFIGTSLVESLKNPKIMVIIVVMLLASYILSKIVNKKLEVE